jgi:hypothetical protein
VSDSSKIGHHIPLKILHGCVGVRPSKRWDLVARVVLIAMEVLLHWVIGHDSKRAKLN